MPGLIAFGRRWSVGSDDLFLPALFLIVVNAVWVVVLACSLPSISAEQMKEKQAFEADQRSFYMTNKQDPSSTSTEKQSPAVAEKRIQKDMPLSKKLPLRFLRLLLTGFVVLFLGSVLLEGSIAYVSNRGSVMEQKPRHSMKLLIYLRASVLLVQFVCCIFGVVWLAELYTKYSHVGATQILIAVIAWQALLFLMVLLFTWCVYDPTGRDWLQVIRYCNKNHDHSACHPGFKRSAPTRRTWRNRRLELQRQNTWYRRCRWLLFCVGRSDPTRKRRMSLVSFSDPEDSLADIAKVLSEFFSQMDIVPSDLVAGLMLLRYKQIRTREKTIEEVDNSTYEFLSGAAITPHTKFLDFNDKESLEYVKTIRYYMQFALAAYGWPFYLTNNKGAVFCDLMKGLRCCGCCRGSGLEEGVVVEDNCCFCNLNALKLTLPSDQIDLIYVNFHCGIRQTPFFVAVDYDKNSLVLCIRGTLSLRDLVTDLSAETENIEVPNMRGANWLAHKGIVKASEYVLNQVKDQGSLEKGFEKLKQKSGNVDPEVILVGHSLGGGIATVVGLMLRDLYPSLKCYVFSPPGGLLSWSAAEATRDFVWTTVVGKDVVARLGLAQMEVLKTEIMGLLKNSKDPKWWIIGHSLPCCKAEFSTDTPEEPLLEHSPATSPVASPLLQNHAEGDGIPEKNSNHLHNSTQALEEKHWISKHPRLYMPGKILHVVRTWTKSSKRARKRTQPSYSAIWVDAEAFDEVLISPVMVHDHMPEGVIDALDKLLKRCEKEILLPPESKPILCETQQTTDDASSKRYSTRRKPRPDGVAPLATPELGLKLSLDHERARSSPACLDLEETDVGNPDSVAPLAEQPPVKKDVRFQIGLSSSSADVVDSLWLKEKDPDIEESWCEMFESDRGPSGVWTEASSMVPEVSSAARLQDLDSETASLTERRAGFRPVATYSGGHLKDVGDTYQEVSEMDDFEGPPPMSSSEEFLGKARSEAFLSVKADTSGTGGSGASPEGNKLHRAREREDLRFDDGSFNGDQVVQGHLVRSPEMENINLSADVALLAK